MTPLSDSKMSVFEGLDAESLAGQTALEGDFTDQSQLHAVLERLRNSACSW
jgi:hypothetical protein